MEVNQYRSLITRIAALSLLICLWQTAVFWLQPAMLPAPNAVLIRMLEQIQNGELPYHLAVTLQRVAASFFIALALGIVIGLAMGHFRKVNDWLDSLLVLALNIPALVTIILCFIWFGLTETAAILAVVLNKTPNVIVTLREGAKAVDQQLLDVARCYHLPFTRTLTQVYLPQLYPYILAASRGGLALVWKIVLVVELLGCSEGVGFQLGMFFQFFDITSILAYTLAFAALILALEAGVLMPIERKINRWRS